MSTWQKNLFAALDTKSVVIIYGNVRDRYIDENNHIYENMTELINGLISQPGFPLQFQFRRICSDASGQERIVSDNRTIPQGRSQESIPDQENELSKTAPKEVAIPQNTTMSRLLAGWNKELRDSAKNTLAVIFYLDKIISYQSSYSDVDKEILLRLEKIVENISGNNRLIMVALQDSMIPIELYTFSPKVRLVSIPLPQQKERQLYLEHRLKTNLEHIKIISDLTDGLYLRDLDSIIESISVQASQGEIRKIINKYRLGEQEDYWGSLSIETLKKAENTFIDGAGYGVKGQDEAVKKVVDTLIVAKAGLSGINSESSAKPKGVLFFAGPSGVGKTFLAKKLAKFLFGFEDAFIRFDMSEYKEEHSVSKIIGSPPGYVGYERGGQLTNAVRDKPFSVVLFDEIEKAHPKIMDVFLQVLDDGRLTDSRGQTIFFSESVIIFTSNIGTRTTNSRGQPIDENSELNRIKSEAMDGVELHSKIREHFSNAVKNFFIQEISRPELLNRIGNNIISFNFIDNENIQKEIVKNQLNQIKTRYEENYKNEKFEMEYTNDLVEYFVKENKAQIAQFGGRAISNIIQDQIMPSLAKYSLGEMDNNASNPGAVFTINIQDNKIIINKTN